jgi:alcohol dehydrogenase (NADP+)
MTSTKGFAAFEQGGALLPYAFERRALRDDDVAIDILYCGVCHSDLHFIENSWHHTIYPVVPGHEIVGRVAATGSAVSGFTAGDLVAVGCLVDSCRVCSPCDRGLEQYCAQGATFTYNSPDRVTGENSLGGYSDYVVVRQEFVLRLPEGLDPARAGPLLCAGITLWSPLRHWKIGSGSKVAIVGLGGLGHMGVKLAVGLGADVTVITSSPSKSADAKALGAHHIVISSDASAMSAATGTFDLVLDTVPVAHDMAPYINLAALDGAVVIVGAIEMIPQFHSGMLVAGRKSLSGSAIGGIAETQELLDFCGEKSILPECEIIGMQDIGTAFERMKRSDVKYRFVIDMSTIEGGAALA